MNLIRIHFEASLNSGRYSFGWFGWEDLVKIYLGTSNGMSLGTRDFSSPLSGYTILDGFSVNAFCIAVN